jgi:hypothetical protein
MEEGATSRRDIVRHHSASRGAGTCPWDPTAARWSQASPMALDVAIGNTSPLYATIRQ